jgi:hypothetical protein
MVKQTVHDQWMAAQRLLKEAKRAAGIEKELEELKERYGFLMTRAKARQHFDNERQIVFAIPDMALRQQVIHLTRECHRLCRENELQTLRDLRKRVSDNGERIRRDHLWGAVVFGITAVFFGEHYGDMTGALAGAVVGVLVGFDHIRRANTRAINDIEEAKGLIPESESFLEELGMDGGFSKTEEETGQPDLVLSQQDLDVNLEYTVT